MSRVLTLLVASCLLRQGALERMRIFSTEMT